MIESIFAFDLDVDDRFVNGDVEVTLRWCPAAEHSSMQSKLILQRLVNTAVGSI
jgi:hypothetical protein